MAKKQTPSRNRARIVTKYLQLTSIQAELEYLVKWYRKFYRGQLTENLPEVAPVLEAIRQIQRTLSAARTDFDGALTPVLDHFTKVCRTAAGTCSCELHTQLQRQTMADEQKELVGLDHLDDEMLASIVQHDYREHDEIIRQRRKEWAEKVRKDKEEAQAAEGAGK